VCCWHLYLFAASTELLLQSESPNRYQLGTGIIFGFYFEFIFIIWNLYFYSYAYFLYAMPCFRSLLWSRRGCYSGQYKTRLICLNNFRYICAVRFFSDPFTSTLIMWFCDHRLARFWNGNSVCVVVIFGEKRSSKLLCHISVVFYGLLPGLQRSFLQCSWCLCKVPLQWEGGELPRILWRPRNLQVSARLYRSILWQCW
jgi:hypothetical protein